MTISSSVKIHSFLSTSDSYLMLPIDLYWFLHSTIYLNADFINFLENKIAVNWEFLRLGFLQLGQQ